MKRNTSILSPLTPESCGTRQPAPDRYNEMARALEHERNKLVERDRTIRNERKRHASIEALTLRMVTQLEQQVADLRSAVFQNLTLRPNTDAK